MSESHERIHFGIYTEGLKAFYLSYISFKDSDLDLST
jgi:hypothetical protein